MESESKYQIICPACEGEFESLPASMCGDHYCTGHERCSTCMDKGFVPTDAGRELLDFLESQGYRRGF